MKGEQDMHYSINVAKNGKHYFATADYSVTSEAQAKDMFEHFKKVFPTEEGYSISVTQYELRGARIAETEEAE